MGKLVAAIAFLAVTALPATALARPHWRRGEEAQVTPMAGWTTMDYDPKTDIAWYGSLHLNTAT